MNAKIIKKQKFYPILMKNQKYHTKKIRVM
jgi:hypothetical protein